MAALPPARIVEFSSADIRRSIDQLSSLLKGVVDGGASVSFIAPLSTADADRYWHKVAGEVERGERVVLVAIIDGGVAGCVHLVPALTANGLHRAEVQKMLVGSAHRRRGLGRALLSAAEACAVRMRRTLLVLDTERHSAGEALYSACGWQRVGVIPNFAANFDGTRLVDTVVFCKTLSADGSNGSDATSDRR